MVAVISRLQQEVKVEGGSTTSSPILFILWVVIFQVLKAEVIVFIPLGVVVIVVVLFFVMVMSVVIMMVLVVVAAAVSTVGPVRAVTLGRRGIQFPPRKLGSIQWLSTAKQKKYK